ncbi:MAG: prepilin-type N-terminal cleavage/methylation domain-containing protein [Alphaproteobacteria bacterium]|nr:prepilin-type N-terminal cleavage/methylation domain-containing protein [Alphaproteobacteria bacterium]
MAINKDYICKSRNSQSGFTLIEMSIVMMIFGIALIAGLKLYDNYMVHNKVVATGSSISLTSRAVSDFRARFGRYPCPASLTAVRGTPDYGREGDCNANGLARDGVTPGDEAPADNASAGTFADGYFVEQSARMVDTDGDSVAETRPLVVRGSVPFRDLNLPEDYAYDGNGYRLDYAVTQRLAVQDTFNPQHGGISIVDTQATPQSLLEVADSGLFVILSHGDDGAGAYTREGQRVETCPTGSDIEKDNCDVSSAEARYTHISRDSQTNTSHFDDQLAYYTGTDDSLWEVAEADSADIILRQDGRVGVNIKITSGVLPEDSLAVNGVIRATSDYRAQQICDQNGNDCFMPDVIGGLIADGGGMECPPGQYMQGIDTAAPECVNIPAVTELRCPAGQIMIGMDANGTLKCSDPPSMCDPANKTICGATQTLPSAILSTQHILTGGSSRQERYQCKNISGVVRWETNPNWTTGVCTCDPTQTQSGTAGCGSGYTGTRPRTRTRVCPAGTWSAWVYTNPFNSDCTCTGYTQSRDNACASGYNSGVDREIRVYTCGGSNNLVTTGWADDPSNPTPCTCVEQNVSETNIACTGGLDGSYSRTNHLSCPGATWDGWVYDYSGCTCDEDKTRTRVVSCTAPQIGTITEQDTYTCDTPTSGHWDDNWTLLFDDCSTPPPTVCTWNPVGTPVQVVTQPAVPRAGAECTCGTGTSGCFEYGDPNYLKYNMCTCE